MWLPTPVYERIPQFWLLLGLLFMCTGTYLGFDYSLSFLDFAVGFACWLWSFWVFLMRLRARKKEQQIQEQAEQLEQQPGDDQNQGAETAA